MTLIGPKLSPPRDGELQVCLATDRAFAPHTEVAAYSVLTQCPGPLRIVILTQQDAIGAFPRLDAAIRHVPNARVEYVTSPFLEALEEREGIRISAMSFARMLIPHLLDGRVLYIDADTLVRGDLGAARTLDMGGHPVAGVLDSGVERFARWLELKPPLSWLISDKRRGLARARFERMRADGVSPDGYTNAGILIFDCDAIQRDAALMRDMLDVQRASQWEAFDQDLINTLFRGRIHRLPQDWNSWHAITWKDIALFRAPDRARFARARLSPRIMHFMATTKPWSNWHIRHLTRGLGWNIVYWRAEAALNRLVTRAGP